LFCYSQYCPQTLQTYRSSSVNGPTPLTSALLVTYEIHQGLNQAGHIIRTFSWQTSRKANPKIGSFKEGAITTNWSKGARGTLLPKKWVSWWHQGRKW